MYIYGCHLMLFHNISPFYIVTFFIQAYNPRGNCGMCKSTIEEAANSVKGVSKADWDVDLKKIKISLLDNKTNIMSIHEAIALSGYDTDKVSGNLDAYNNLPGCCQYDHEMTMNQSKK